MLCKLACLTTFFAMVATDSKVPVSVYYESLCPDSIAFVTKQLVPAYNTQLKNHMDLTLVPYGKASHQRSPDGQRWEFKCHHGPVECYGNKVQGCVLKQIRNQDDQIKYVNCLMNQAKTLKNEYPLGNCIHGGDRDIVTNCANGTHGESAGADILAANGDVTARLDPPLTSVPTVVFNKRFNATEQTLAQTDFRKVLCSYLMDKCPSEACDACNSGTSLYAPTLLLLLASTAIFRLL